MHSGAAQFAKKHELLSLQWETPSADTMEARREAIDRGLRKKPQAIVYYVDRPEVASEYAGLLRSYSGLQFTLGPLDRPNNVQGHVRINIEDAAAQLAKVVWEHADERQSYVLIHAASAGAWQASCTSRFLSALKDTPTPHQLMEIDYAAQKISARAAVDEALEQFPHATLVVTLDPSAWLEQPYRPLPKTCAFASLGLIPELILQLREGAAIAVVGPSAEEAGRAAVQMAFAATVDGNITREAAIISPTVMTRASAEESAPAGDGNASTPPDDARIDGE